MVALQQVIRSQVQQSATHSDDDAVCKVGVAEKVVEVLDLCALAVVREVARVQQHVAWQSVTMMWTCIERLTFGQDELVC